MPNDTVNSRAFVSKGAIAGGAALLLGQKIEGSRAEPAASPRDVVSKGLSEEEFEVASASRPVDSRLIRMHTSWSNRFTFRKEVRNLLAF